MSRGVCGVALLVLSLAGCAAGPPGAPSLPIPTEAVVWEEIGLALDSHRPVLTLGQEEALRARLERRDELNDQLVGFSSSERGRRKAQRLTIGSGDPLLLRVLEAYLDVAQADVARLAVRLREEARLLRELAGSMPTEPASGLSAWVEYAGVHASRRAEQMLRAQERQVAERDAIAARAARAESALGADERLLYMAEVAREVERLRTADPMQRADRTSALVLRRLETRAVERERRRVQETRLARERAKTSVLNAGIDRELERQGDRARSRRRIANPLMAPALPCGPLSALLQALPGVSSVPSSDDRNRDDVVDRW